MGFTERKKYWELIGKKFKIDEYLVGDRWGIEVIVSDTI